MAEQRFSYHRAVAPMMWVLVGISVVELVIAHLLVALLWNVVAAAVLSLLTIVGIAWLGMTIASMKRRPVLLDDERLLMRAGTLKAVSIPVSAIAGLSDGWDAPAMKARSVLKLSLIAYPNIVVDLIAPLPGRRGITAIAHRLDDPAAFAAAIERLGRTA